MGGEDGEREEDPGGGGEGQGQDEKQGREVEKHGGKENGEGLTTGRVRLKGALLQTYVLSILIRSIMEVHETNYSELCGDFKPLLTNCFWLHSSFTLWYSLSSKSWLYLAHVLAQISSDKFNK